MNLLHANKQQNTNTVYFKNNLFHMTLNQAKAEEKHLNLAHLSFELMQKSLYLIQVVKYFQYCQHTGSNKKPHLTANIT